MKALFKLKKQACIAFLCLLCATTTNAQIEFKTFKRNPIPIVSEHSSPFAATLLDYHDFKIEGKSRWATTKGSWYLKYKAMFDFRCKEPFMGVGITYAENGFRTGYTFRLVDCQIVEDSIGFLKNKYLYNNADTLRRWNLPPRNTMEPARTEGIIRRLGIEYFTFVAVVFDPSKHSKFIEVPESGRENDFMTYMEIFRYPADVDVFVYDFEIDNWVYVGSVTVSGDHELELYVLHRFAPRYLKNCRCPAGADL